jgi:inner membrane protease subunit 1
MWSAGAIWYFTRHAAVRSIQILAAGHIFTEHIAAPIPCGGFSMVPTLNYTDDVMLITPIPYWRRRPARGEMVVYRKPTDTRVVVLKRIIAVEGDVVEVDPRRGDGSLPPNPNAAPNASKDKPPASILYNDDRWGEGKYIRVPKGHVWCVGDNLTNSSDSRDYGPVPVALIKGMAVARVSHCQELRSALWAMQWVNNTGWPKQLAVLGAHAQQRPCPRPVSASHDARVKRHSAPITGRS